MKTANPFNEAITLASVLLFLLTPSLRAASAVATPVAEPAVTVGDPANPAGLAKAIQDAYRSGARKIAVSKGVYRLPDAPGDVCKLEKWQDAEISGKGVTLIAEIPTGHYGRMSSIFELRQCQRVTLSGFVISQSEVSFRQGKVTAIDSGDGAAASWSCVWKPDAGYPELPMPPDMKAIGSWNIVDPATRRLKVKAGDMGGLTWAPESGGGYRLRGFKAPPNLAVGDWLVTRRDEVNRPYKIRLIECEDCTVRAVTLSRSWFAPIREDFGSANRIIACRWEPGPKPPGATEEPLVASSADGFHSMCARKGPVIEDCVMQGILLDDCIAINGEFSQLVKTDGAALTLVDNKCGLAPNEPILISGKTGPHQRAMVKAIGANADKTVKVTLDRAINPPGEGGIAWAPWRCGAGYRIARCKIGNTRSRGILVKADDGEIRDNVIADTRMAAVNIGPESYYKETGYWGRIAIENNTIVNCGGYAYGRAAIWVHGHGSGTIDNGDLVVRGNRFTANYQGDVEIEGANNVLVTGNTFTGRTSWPFSMPLPALARVSNSQEVRFLANAVSDPAAYATPLVKSGMNVSGITVDWAKQP